MLLVSECSKVRGCKDSGYLTGCCRVSVEPGLAITVNCLLTLFTVIFAKGLGARTDCLLGCSPSEQHPQAALAANKAAPGQSECS